MKLLLKYYPDWQKKNNSIQQKHLKPMITKDKLDYANGALIK